jgi:UDP-N-acetyl-D-galactosamine dehydrogenase
MKKGRHVVYESTVYPGATEEVCIPLLEKHSGMKWKQDFHVGYSPERVNPGDKERTITKIVKVVSGDTKPETLKTVGEVLRLGHRRRRAPRQQHQGGRSRQGHRKHPARPQHRPDERTGPDLRQDRHRHPGSAAAAGTKWNFLPFRPGLVGGHCIGVDPYYLTHKAEMLGYHPEVILAGRRINDGMAAYVAEADRQAHDPGGSCIKGAKVIVLGLTFKENCPDLRKLQSFGCDVSVHDPSPRHKKPNTNTASA